MTGGARAFARVVAGGVSKNWRLSITYPTWVLNRIVGPFIWVSLAVYAYIGLAHPAEVSQAFDRLAATGDFTGFLILGQTFFSFFTSLNWRGGMAIQRERWYGTLEVILLAPTSRLAYLLGESLFGLVDQGWTIFLAMVIAAYVYGARFSVGDPFLVLVAVLLTLAAMVALGVFFAGFYVLTRSAGPLSQAVQAPVRFFSGVQFPIAALPLAAQAVSYAIPVTYGLNAVRGALLMDASWADLAPTFAILAGFTVGLFLAGVGLVAVMERLAKMRGTLHQY